MTDKQQLASPESFNLITYAWVLGLACLGGLVNFMRKFKDDNKKVFNILEFVGELAASAFAGVITFYLCQRQELDQLTTAAIVGVSGHSASRTLYLMQKFIDSKFPAIKNGDKND